jgi:ATP-dependent Clp protease protease subunit
MLMDYKGRVTVKIDGLAASAASVIAMAGEGANESGIYDYDSQSGYGSFWR